MLRELMGLLFLAIILRLQRDTFVRFVSVGSAKPSDLMRSTQVPMNRRITNPPNMVFISGMPLCFAYGAYETTNKLAAPPNTIFNQTSTKTARETASRTKK